MCYVSAKSPDWSEAALLEADVPLDARVDEGEANNHDGSAQEPQARQGQHVLHRDVDLRSDEQGRRRRYQETVRPHGEHSGYQVGFTWEEGDCFFIFNKLSCISRFIFLNLCARA